jgi:hypothetical protein
MTIKKANLKTARGRERERKKRENKTEECR